jgi:hypothetical protein
VPRQLRNMNASVEELEAFIKASGYGEPETVDYKNKKWAVQTRYAAPHCASRRCGPDS